MRGVDRVIAAWQSRPPGARPLILSDFDGTLAEYQLDPKAVTLTPSRQILLQTLSARADFSSGIVSGRRISDLRDRVPAAASMFIAGLHGLEIEGPGFRFLHNGVALAASGLSFLTKDLRRAVKPLAGVFVEDNTYAVVLHVRGASTADRRHAITRFNALSEPLLSEGTVRLQPGDHVLELLPNVDWAKGDAVRAIIRHVEADTKETVWPVYIGDDRTDEDAFEEIGTNGLTIAVGKRPGSASFQVDNPAAVECFLKAILVTE
ncbi:MAG: trehalose-phosphatase [Vicinamibacterales bacterium]